MNNGISKYNTFCDNVIINPNEQSGTGCKYSLGGTELVDAAAAAGDFSTVTGSVVAVPTFVADEPGMKTACAGS